MARVRFTLPLILFAIICLFLWRGMGTDPSLLPSALETKPVPSFEAPSLLSAATINQQNFKGKVTILNVWASWCASCQLELPLLMDLSNKTQIQLYGLNYKDGKQTAREFLKTNGNPYTDIIADSEGKYAMQLGVYGTPETFLIDKKGIIRKRYVGALTLDILEKDLLPHIAQLQEESA